MLYIGLGALGFLIGLLFDWASLRGVRGAKPILWLTHCLLLAYATIMLCLEPDRIVLPSWTAPIGWVGIGASALLLGHALFLNIPFKKTYVSGAEKRKLVTTGAYALVRHPGVLWLGLLLGSLFLASGSRLLLLALPLWMVIDMLWVALEEKYIFNKLFDGYEAYASKTPMLIPNRRSIGAFLTSLKHPKEPGKADARIP